MEYAIDRSRGGSSLTMREGLAAQKLFTAARHWCGKAPAVARRCSADGRRGLRAAETRWQSGSGVVRRVRSQQQPTADGAPGPGMAARRQRLAQAEAKQKATRR